MSKHDVTTHATGFVIAPGQAELDKKARLARAENRKAKVGKEQATLDDILQALVDIEDRLSELENK